MRPAPPTGPAARSLPETRSGVGTADPTARLLVLDPVSVVRADRSQTTNAATPWTTEVLPPQDADTYFFEDAARRAGYRLPAEQPDHPPGQK